MSSINKINVGGVDFDIASSPTPVMAPVETSTTATQAYAVGDYVIVGSTLHEVTAAIAIGDTFTEGTNISTSTSLGDEIKQINNDLTEKVSYSDVSNTLYTITGNFEETMSEACVLVGILQATVNGGDRVLSVNGVTIGYAQNNGSYNNNNSIYYPLKIGDVVKLTGGNTVNSLKIYKQY